MPRAAKAGKDCLFNVAGDTVGSVKLQTAIEVQHLAGDETA